MKIKRYTGNKQDYCAQIKKAGWRNVQITKYKDVDECFLEIENIDFRHSVKMNDLAMLAVYELVKDFLKFKNLIPN